MTDRAIRDELARPMGAPRVAPPGQLAHTRTRWKAHGGATQARAVARVNHGRWIIDCPFCPSATLAHDRTGQQKERFICSECGNGAAGRRYVEVAWPAPSELARIVRTLVARPNMETRNWQPGETVDMLDAENAAHGVRR